MATRKNFAATLVLMFCAISSFAQVESYRPNPFIAARINATVGDAQGAFQYGIEWVKIPAEAWSFGVLGEFETRLFGKDQLVPISAHLRHQYQEVRAQLGIGSYMAYQISPFNELRLGIGVGVNFGKYRGVSVAPPTQISPSIEVGYSLQFSTPIVLTLGYQYRDWPHTTPHRFGITWTRYLGRAR
jgi:hypothetical protein